MYNYVSQHDMQCCHSQFICLKILHELSYFILILSINLQLDLNSQVCAFAIKMAFPINERSCIFTLPTIVSLKCKKTPGCINLGTHLCFMQTLQFAQMTVIAFVQRDQWENAILTYLTAAIPVLVDLQPVNQETQLSIIYTCLKQCM